VSGITNAAASAAANMAGRAAGAPGAGLGAGDRSRQAAGGASAEELERRKAQEEEGIRATL